jgi:signal transduction histidine kinase
MIPARSDGARLQQLVDQEAALRRLAELAARGAAPNEVFEAIVVAAAQLHGTALTTLARFEHDGSGTILALHGFTAGYRPGTRQAKDGGGILDLVLRTGRPARVSYADPGGDGPQLAQGRGFSAAVGAPIHIDGQLWGALVASAREEPLPSTLDAQLATFAELLGPAIAGTQARTELLGLVDEQAALRRVAELVARGCGQQELFEAVAQEASRLVHGEATTLLRVEADGSGPIIIATSGGAPVPVGTTLRIAPDDEGLVAGIIRTRQPARVDSYARVSGTSYARDDYGVGSSVGVPIIVEDALWGILAFSTPDHELPVGSERRLQQFADLVAAALANAQARAELQELAEEQAALRRVAELVARAAVPEEVFAAVATEASRLLDEAMTLARLDGERNVIVVASEGGPAAVGSSIPFAPDTLASQVLQAGRTVRVDDFARDADAPLAVLLGIKAAVSAPITIEGRTWGLLTATSAKRPLPFGTEARLTQFAELIAAALANADSRAALSASRARVVATADEVRRRLQRDVHDRVQQRLVHTIVTLKLAREELRDVGGPAAQLVDESLVQAQQAATELGDVVRGILPAALTRGGLQAGVESLLAGLPLDVDLRVECARVGTDLETTAYFVVAEALTNVVKHAHTDRALVHIAVEGDDLSVEVRDGGVGGADVTLGTGLTGLFDRVGAADGTLTVTSPGGAGTTVRATLPLGASDHG